MRMSDATAMQRVMTVWPALMRWMGGEGELQAAGVAGDLRPTADQRRAEVARASPLTLPSPPLRHCRHFVIQLPASPT